MFKKTMISGAILAAAMLTMNPANAEWNVDSDEVEGQLIFRANVPAFCGIKVVDEGVFVFEGQSYQQGEPAKFETFHNGSGLADVELEVQNDSRRDKEKVSFRVDNMDTNTRSESDDGEHEMTAERGHQEFEVSARYNAPAYTVDAGEHMMAVEVEIECFEDKED